MEYLMTYGWAILIIAVVLGALFELGVFNGTFFMPHVPPGSCHIFRPYGPRTVGSINLEGECQGALPQYVAQFDGTENSYIKISNPMTINVNQYSYTVSAWIYTTMLVDANAEAIFKGVNNNYADFGLSLNSPGQDGICGWVNGMCGSSVCSSKTLINTNQWYFVTGVWSVGTTYAAIYVNGKFVGDCASAGSPYSGTALPEIASGPDLNGYNTAFQGDISNVQVYNASLSANDISALYLEGIGGAPINLGNLVAWWPLNGNANDYSGNNNDGTAVNVIYTTNWENGYTQP
jgi:hypothetical protein